MADPEPRSTPLPSQTDRLRSDLLTTQEARQKIQDEITSLEQRHRDLLIREQQLTDDLHQLLPAAPPASISSAPPKPTPPSSRFLTTAESESNRGKIMALASYPRCGNSLLRSILEKLTGVITGSDSDPNRALIRQLKAMGFQGEGLTSGAILAVKTHFPERLGHESFACGRAIVLVRNPFDAIVSYFNMVLTQTHTKSLKRSEFAKYERIWRDFVKEEVEYWKEFYRQWLAVKSIPTLILRYEDLVQHRPKAIAEIVEFMKDIKLDDVDIRENIAAICGQEITEAGVYLPRNVGLLREEGKDLKESAGADGKQDSKEKCEGADEDLVVGDTFLSSRDIYSEDQIEYVLAAAKEMLVTFGYWESLPAGWKAKMPAPLRKRRCLVPGIGSNEAKANQVVLNSKDGIRPRTEDDPNGRGFGKRWKRRLAMLPPVQMTNGRKLEWKEINFNNCQYG